MNSLTAGCLTLDLGFDGIIKCILALTEALFHYLHFYSFPDLFLLESLEHRSRNFAVFPFLYVLSSNPVDFSLALFSLSRSPYKITVKYTTQCTSLIPSLQNCWHCVIH